jgi:AraC-like DNA-binding protein
LDQPLLLAAAEQMVAASLLATFPNTTMTIEVRSPRDPAAATTVRRAMAFIDAHAGRPLTLTEIATAVGVVPRTLQYAFRRHQDTTPLAHLRRVRLARAHAELVAAELGDGTTVAAVAGRWGYARPSGFVAAYRQAYGQLPAQTLRS